MTRDEIADGLMKDETLRKDKQLDPDKLNEYLNHMDKELFRQFRDH
jgi:hypothetical protein